LEIHTDNYGLAKDIDEKGYLLFIRVWDNSPNISIGMFEYKIKDKHVFLQTLPFNTSTIVLQ
jgi:hypothetical protein